MRTLGTACVLAAACLLLSHRTLAQGAEASQRIVLLLVSTKDDVKDPNADLTGLTSLFKNGKEALQRDKGIAVGFESKPPGIGYDERKQLFDLLDSPVTNDRTTLVCYMKLHGYTDGNTDEHVMRLDNSPFESVQEVRRSEVLQRLRRHKARLLILITDSCSALKLTKPPITTNYAPEPFPTTLFADLFVYSSGVVNINSSSYRRDGHIVNEKAWVDVQGAGVFTGVFKKPFSTSAGAMEAILKRVDINGNQRYSWAEYANYLTTKTNDEFGAYRKHTLALPGDNVDAVEVLQLQDSQYPQVFGELSTTP